MATSAGSKKSWADPASRKRRLAAVARSREKRSLAVKAAWKDPKKRSRLLANLEQRIAVLKIANSDTVRLSEVRKRMWADPAMRSKIILARRKSSKRFRPKSEKQRRKISESVKQAWADGKYAHKQYKPLTEAHLNALRRNAAARKGIPRSEAVRRKISNGRKGILHSQKTKRVLSLKTKAKWADPIYRARMLESRQLRPNKLEARLTPEMKKFGFYYSGDGSRWIHTKNESHNPDFKMRGKRVLVEIWGDYWHRGEDPDRLIHWYAKQGYLCLVIWERDLASISIIEHLRPWLVKNDLISASREP